MRQQVANRNLVLGRNRIHAFFRIGQHLHIGEFRQKFGNGLVELHLAFANQNHRGNARDGLRHRIDAP